MQWSFDCASIAAWLTDPRRKASCRQSRPFSCLRRRRFAHALAEPDLIAAVRTGDLAAARDLIAADADPDAPQGDGATALHWAAHRGDVEAAALLIEAGADVNAANRLGATPLWLAARSGNAPIVEALLEAGANPNVTLRMGETPLMSAARSGNLRVVEMLVDRGAAVNAVEYERHQTPLMWAAAQQHAEIVRLLAARGANVHARTRVWDQLENTAGNTNTSGNFRKNHGGSTALLFAARNGDVETARALVEAGADVNDVAAAVPAPWSSPPTAATDPSASTCSSRAPTRTRRTPATRRCTPRRCAARSRWPRRSSSAAPRWTRWSSAARRAGGSAPTSASATRRWGANAFWLAARYGELEILRMLAERGADPHVSPTSRWSALKAAMGVPQISQEDRRNRVDAPDDHMDRIDQEQLTLDLARIILDLRVDVNQTDDRGNTALHDAVRTGFASVVDLLAAHGADLDAPNDRGQTPLILAETLLPVIGSNGLRSTQPEIAARLRELGADE